MPVREAQAALAEHWNRQIPVDPAQIAQRVGARVIADEDMMWSDLSGCFDIENGIPTIRYNPADARVRQRFTIAHELGHMLLNHGRAMRDNAANYYAGVKLYRERDANSFAAELLMPTEVVEWMVNTRGDRDISKMARDLDVSEAAMRYRLINLGMIR